MYKRQRTITIFCKSEINKPYAQIMPSATMAGVNPPAPSDGVNSSTMNSTDGINTIKEGGDRDVSNTERVLRSGAKGNSKANRGKKQKLDPTAKKVTAAASAKCKKTHSLPSTITTTTPNDDNMTPSQTAGGINVNLKDNSKTDDDLDSETHTTGGAGSRSTLTGTASATALKAMEFKLAREKKEKERLEKIVTQLEKSRGGFRGVRLPKKLKTTGMILLEEDVFHFVSTHIYPNYKFLLKGWDVYDNTPGMATLSNHAFQHLKSYYPKDAVTREPCDTKEFWALTLVPIISLKMIARKNSSLQSLRGAFYSKCIAFYFDGNINFHELTNFDVILCVLRFQDNKGANGYVPTDKTLEGWMKKPLEDFLQDDLNEYTKFIFEYTICMKNKITLLHKMKNNAKYYTGGKTILDDLTATDHAFAIALYVNNYEGWIEKFPYQGDRTNKIHREVKTKWTQARGRKYLGCGWAKEGEEFYTKAEKFFQQMLQEVNSGYYEELQRSVQEYYKATYGVRNVGAKPLLKVKDGQDAGNKRSAAVFDNLFQDEDNSDVELDDESEGGGGSDSGAENDDVNAELMLS